MPNITVVIGLGDMGGEADNAIAEGTDDRGNGRNGLTVVGHCGVLHARPTSESCKLTFDKLCRKSLILCCRLQAADGKVLTRSAAA